MHLRSKGNTEWKRLNRLTFLAALLLYYCAATTCGVAQILPKTADAVVLRLTKVPLVDYRGWPEVRLDVGFTDRRSRPDLNIQANQIQLFENDVPQQVVSLGKPDMPASICILVDTSSSMKQHWYFMLKAVEAFVEASNPEDEFVLLSFDKDVEVAQQPTKDRAKVIAALKHLQPVGVSALFDAVAITAEQAAPLGSNPLKVVTVFSDGDNNYSRLSLSDLLKRLKVGSAPIISAVVVDSIFSDQGLAETAVETGGTTFKADSLELEKAGTLLAEDIRSRQELIYTTSQQEQDGKLRKLKVTVPPSLGKVKVHARQEFYAPSK